MTGFSSQAHKHQCIAPSRDCVSTTNRSNTLTHTRHELWMEERQKHDTNPTKKNAKFIHKLYLFNLMLDGIKNQRFALQWNTEDFLFTSLGPSLTPFKNCNLMEWILFSLCPRIRLRACWVFARNVVIGNGQMLYKRLAEVKLSSVAKHRPCDCNAFVITSTTITATTNEMNWNSTANLYTQQMQIQSQTHTSTFIHLQFPFTPANALPF